MSACPTSMLGQWRDFACTRADGHPGWHYGQSSDGLVWHFHPIHGPYGPEPGVPNPLHAPTPRDDVIEVQTDPALFT